MTTFTVGFPFCGLGGGALGFLAAESRLFGRAGRFRSVGGIDIDPLACRDFERLTGTPALCADIGEMTPGELRTFMGADAPDVVFGSPPCKGLSSLLSTKQAKTAKYRRLNGLVLAWVKLVLAAWPARPPRLLLLENVPRIAGPRGRRLLAAVKALLRRAGYVFHEGTHDCGELGGLAQHRKRYLLVARHPTRCPPLLYQPPKRRVRACGEVLERLPLPGEGGGPMHELPRLSWLNWVRLALIPAGGDWRDLPGVLLDGQPRREVFRRHHVGRWTEPTATVAGSGSNGPSAVADPRVVRDYDCPGPDCPACNGEACDKCGAGERTRGPDAPRCEHDVIERHERGEREWHRGALGVLPFDGPAGTVTGNGRPASGRFAVADPRIIPQAGNANLHWGKYEVRDWSEPAATVIGAGRVGSGAPSVADPRPRERDWYTHVYKVVPWALPTGTVTGAGKPSSGAASVADPRVRDAFDHGYAVLRWGEASSTVAGGSHPGQGAYSVADPRLEREARRGVLGVIPWREAAKTVTGEAWPGNGAFAVQDPRTEEVMMVIRDVRKSPPRVPVIVAEDGTWHRPLTTLELAALQGFPTTMPDGSPLTLASRDGKANHSAWRERIGNAVPPPTAQAIAEQMLVALLQADAETWMLSGDGAVWVRERAEALA